MFSFPHLSLRESSLPFQKTRGWSGRYHFKDNGGPRHGCPLFVYQADFLVHHGRLSDFLPIRSVFPGFLI